MVGVVLLWNKVKDPAWRNRCIVCDQELSGDFWHTPKATIYRRVARGAIDGRTVAVHVECMSKGEVLALDEGLAWRAGVDQLTEGPPEFPPE